MCKSLIIGASALMLAALTIWEIRHPPRPKMLYNPSGSAPVGYYKIKADINIKQGDWVAAFAPDAARKLASDRDYLPENYPLIKQVWAAQGQIICANSWQVSGPNGSVLTRARQDRLGRDMPWFEGCMTLDSGQYFLVSIDENYGRLYGFDSRYFGPVEQKHILGRVEYLGTSLFVNDENHRETGADMGK